MYIKHILFVTAVALLGACGNASEDTRGDGTTNEGTPPTENTTNPGNASNADQGTVGDTIGTPAPSEDMARP